MSDIATLERIATQVRRDIIRQTSEAQSGHPGGSLGCADFLTALYFEIMDRHDDFRMDGSGEDVFLLSNGHISPAWYSVLARSGHFPVSELNTFRKINSRLQGHPATHEGLPGVRVASGSLGQGLSVAIGMALAKRLDDDEKLVYVLTGDGELQEGQIWEAAMFAAHHRIDNLIATVDHNGQQIDGPVASVIGLGQMAERWKAFGWEVLHNPEGNNMRSIVNSLKQARALAGKGKPVVIIMDTEMGKGVDFMEGTHEWHGKAPNAEQTRQALEGLKETLGDY